MAGNVEIIQLETHDDVVSVRDRLAFVKAYRVLLVWPPQGRVLQRKLDLVLLQREARRRAARLALVTQDLDVIDNARDLNISVFNSVEDSQRQRWQRGRSKVFVDRADKPESDPDPDDLRGAASRLRADPAPSQIALGHTVRIVALLVLLFATLGAVVIFLPSATVALTPARERLNVTIHVTADPNVQSVDIESGVVPASLLRVEIEESATVQATGNLEPPETLVSGLVLFTNQTDQAVTIPAGTTVSTSAGAIVRFRTLEPVNIAGQTGAIAAVAVEALPEYAGARGNVPAYAIDHVDGPLGDLLTVQNLDPFGTEEVPDETVVSQGDHDRLLAAVRQGIQARALDALTPLLGEGQEIIPESIAIVEERPEWTHFSASVGEAAENVSLTMRAAVQAVVVDGRLVNQAAFAGLAGRIPPGRVVVPDTMAFSRDAVESVDSAGRVIFRTTVSSNVVIAVQIETLRQALAGRDTGDALTHLYETLDLDPTAPPEITIWPSFWSQMPLLPARITVVVRETP